MAAKSGACALLLAALLAVLLAIGAAQNDKEVGEQLMRTLSQEELRGAMSDDETRDLLKKVHEIDPQNEEARELSRLSKPSELHCTRRYQQWLISKMVQKQRDQGPIRDYLRGLHEQYRQLCAAKFEKRLVLALAGVDVEAQEEARRLSDRLNETDNFRDHLKRLDNELPVSSLAEALREHLDEESYQVAQAEVAEEQDEQIKRMLKASDWARARSFRSALRTLMDSCQELADALDDSLWLLKIIEHPQKLSPQTERQLWDAKVCQIALNLDRFEVELRDKYNAFEEDSKTMVGNFVGLLKAPADVWRDANYKPSESSFNEAIERSMMLKSPDADFMEQLKLTQSLIRKLDGACKLHLEQLGNFLWLMDVGLKDEIHSKKSADILRRVRVCSANPF